MYTNISKVSKVKVRRFRMKKILSERSIPYGQFIGRRMENYESALGM